MIRLEAIPKELRHRLPKMDAGATIEILTYKRNRGLVITLRGDGTYHIREHGYHSEEFEAIGQPALLKLVARIAKREFPRSTNVRLYTHAPRRAIAHQRPAEHSHLRKAPTGCSQQKRVLQRGAPFLC